MNNIKIKLDLLIYYLIILFPLFMILGSALLNLFSVIMSIYALLHFSNLKKLIISNERIFLFIFSFFLFIFPYDSIDFEQSLIKFISYFRNILMFFGIIFFLNNIQNQNFISKTKNIYFIILVIIAMDVLKEYFTGTNLLGYSAEYIGRIASFTNDELIIGYIFAFLTLFSYGLFKFTDKKFYILLFFFFIIISFIIGERSNFLKLLLLISIGTLSHYFLKNNFSYLKLFKSLFLIILLFAMFFFIMKDTNQAKKLYNIGELKTINFKENNFILDKFYNSKHAPHYFAAFEIFLNYPVFGIGINNFSKESKKQEYLNLKLKYFNNRSTTHPHQIYLELLSEVGLMGFCYFIIIFIWSSIIGIKSYLASQNLHLLGHLMLHIFFIFPFLPSGSFFGTTYGLPFWLNFSILIYFVKKKEINNLLNTLL